MRDIPAGVPRRNELLRMLEQRLKQLEADGAEDSMILLYRGVIYNMTQVDVTSDYASNNARVLREVKKGVETAIEGIYVQMRSDLDPGRKREAYHDFATKINGGRAVEVEIKKLDLSYRMKEALTSRGFIVLLIVIYMLGQWLGIEIPVSDFLGKG